MSAIEIKTAGSVTTIYFNEVRAGWEQWCFLSSDRHHDSATCNRALEKKHLDECKERNALIIDAGDMFDAMNGRFDPRRSYDTLRPEYLTEDYYGAILEEAANFYGPYAKNLALLGRGNHETAVSRAANINLNLLLGRMLQNDGFMGAVGGFGGWVRFMFTNEGTPLGSLKMRYFHGAGAEARTTKGVSNARELMMYAPDADLILNGHNHHAYIVAERRERLSNKGVPFFDMCWLLRTPGYNDTFGDGMRGWANENGHIPKPLGGIWVRLSYEDKRPKATPTLAVE